MNILCDYLVMSFKTSGSYMLDFLVDYLNLPFEEFEIIKSYYGCGLCYFYRSIKIHIDDSLLILDLSGSGCRSLEDLNPDFDFFEFIKLFDYDIQNRDYDLGVPLVHISRFDIACDLYDDSLTMDKLRSYVRNCKFVCKSCSYLITEGTDEECIYFGSKNSDRRLRIYDKALEKHAYDEDWIRFEFQLRNKNALSFYLNLLKYNGNWGYVFRGVLHDYLRFTSKPAFTLEKIGKKKKLRVRINNYNRIPICRWWLDFLRDVEKIKQLYLPGSEYNMDRLNNFLVKVCSSSLKTSLIADGGDLTNLLELINGSKLNSRQINLLNSLGFEIDLCNLSP